MSKITGDPSEPFAMRVVSGMLVDGSLRVSWATGQKASKKLYWGFEKTALNETPVFNAEPKDMERYHEIFFPQTLLGAIHYFRVESVTASGKRGVSRLYFVQVPDKIFPGVTTPTIVPLFTTIAAPFAVNTGIVFRPETIIGFGDTHEVVMGGYTARSADQPAPQQETSIPNQSAGTGYTITIT